jgi:hypothetical protein
MVAWALGAYERGISFAGDYIHGRYHWIPSVCIRSKPSLGRAAKPNAIPLDRVLISEEKSLCGVKLGISLTTMQRRMFRPAIGFKISTTATECMRSHDESGARKVV